MGKILYEGKSKTIYSSDEEGSYIIHFRDSATAFNGEKKCQLKGKGRLNCLISLLIYRYLMANGIKTHLIKAIDEERILAKKAEIIMVEVIVRNVAAGSFSKKYGIAEGQPLLNTVVEFSLKSDELSDPMINKSQITALSVATEEELNQMIEESLKINKLLTELFLRAGIRLIDFKLEFGRADGEIILCDEISPDSCRLWESGSDKKLDKDRFRREMGGVIEGYAEVLKRLEQTL